MSELLHDRAGRVRSPATTPGFHAVSVAAAPSGVRRMGFLAGTPGLAPHPSGWLTLGLHIVQRAWVGDMRAARIAGRSPAMAPMARAAVRPPAQARAGMTVFQCLVWA
jgi:hypothetical protein